MKNTAFALVFSVDQNVKKIFKIYWNVLPQMALLFHVSGDRSFYFQITGIIHRNVVVYHFDMGTAF